MRKIIFAAVASLGAIAATSPAFAQDSGSTSSRSIEPYVGVTGVWDSFDSKWNGGVPQGNLDGWLVEGVAGVNVPIGEKFFVGVEGNVAKGLHGDIDWEYGGAGRAGIRLNDSGMFYGKVGYKWVKFDRPVANDKSYDGVVWGAGVEVSPGIGRLRIRAEATTTKGIDSIRPSLGAVMAF